MGTIISLSGWGEKANIFTITVINYWFCLHIPPSIFKCDNILHTSKSNTIDKSKYL